MIAAVVISILVVHLIRTRSVDHAWKIASGAGAAVGVIIASAGSIALKLDISFAVILLSAVLGIAVGLILEIFFFAVDYSRSENIQFEDDEYYYYVKAIPKVGVSAPEKQVKHITEDAGGRNTEDILLTRSLSKELGIDKEKTE